DGKDPLRRPIKEQHAHPAADERFGGRAAAGNGFPYGERTGEAEQRLARDVRDRRQVRIAEPAVAHPLPAERGADPYPEQAADDKKHDAEVDDEDRVDDHAGEHGTTALSATDR